METLRVKTAVEAQVVALMVVVVVVHLHFLEEMTHKLAAAVDHGQVVVSLDFRVKVIQVLVVQVIYL